MIVFIHPTRVEVSICPADRAPKVRREIRLGPLEFLNDAGKAKIAKTDFAIGVNQDVGLVIRDMDELLGRRKERIYNSRL